MKIMGILQPFTMQQSFYVYDNGNKIEICEVKDSNDIGNVVITLAEKYSINDVQLVGPLSYVEGIKNMIQKNEISKYNEYKLNITFLQK